VSLDRKKLHQDEIEMFPTKETSGRKNSDKSFHKLTTSFKSIHQNENSCEKKLSKNRTMPMGQLLSRKQDNCRYQNYVSSASEEKENFTLNTSKTPKNSNIATKLSHRSEPRQPQNPPTATQNPW